MQPPPLIVAQMLQLALQQYSLLPQTALPHGVPALLPPLAAATPPGAGAPPVALAPPVPAAPPVDERPPVPEHSIVMQPPPLIDAQMLQLALQQYSLEPQTALPHGVPALLPPLAAATPPVAGAPPVEIAPPVETAPPVEVDCPPTEPAPPPRLALPLQAHRTPIEA